VGWECHIGDEVFVGGHFTGANDKSMKWPLPPGEIFEPTGYRIMDGAKIGLATVLAPGITVGHRAFIEIGSVVTRSVGRYERWGGPFAEKKGELKQ
jgi:acetyltransferase-like isoleucine patch superfamily enzyme